MTETTVSVVVPAYNASEYVTDAIHSVLNQTFGDLEIIVVDDGSTDATADCIKRIDDPRIQLVQQNNQGQSAAINKGVACSTGAYIKLLDADDWINPKHIAAQLDVLERTGNQVASCRWGYFVEDSSNPKVRTEFSNRNYEAPLEWLFDSLTLDEGMMGGWMWLIPRHLWDKAGGFDPRLNLNNDFHFSIKLLLASGGVRFAEDAVYSYRKGMTGALSSSSGRESMASAFLTTKLGTDLLLESEDSERIRKICADRFQQWLFRFYPQFPDLVGQTERRIGELGGSDLELQGGRILKLLKPLVGWKGVRRLQVTANRVGWAKVSEYKARQRRALLEN